MRYLPCVMRLLRITVRPFRMRRRECRMGMMATCWGPIGVRKQERNKAKQHYGALYHAVWNLQGGICGLLCGLAIS